MSFAPAHIDDDTTVSGHLDAHPIFEVLTTLANSRTTGRLTIEDAAGANHMFFMQGRPVGVKLAEYMHPLGQILLEQGSVAVRDFLRAQRVIVRDRRLPGSVFKELGIIDEAGLKDVLKTQARRKAGYFCQLAARPFVFAKGLSYLTGFEAAPMDPHAVAFLAVTQQMDDAARDAWLLGAAGQEVRGTKAADELLPAPAAVFGFGPPEQRFLRRICADWAPVDDLAETGTLPPGEMAVLLRYLELIGRIELRKEQPRVQEPTAEPVVSPSEPTAPVIMPPVHTVQTAPAAGVVIAPDLLEEPKPSRSQRAPGPAPLGAPVKKKKRKRRRDVPLPSDVAGVTESQTRREKTQIAALPKIMIDLE